MKHEDSLLFVFDSPERGEAERYAMANLPRDLGEEIIAEILDTPTPDDEMTRIPQKETMSRFGIAEGVFTVPDEFDSWDNEIADMFEDSI